MTGLDKIVNQILDDAGKEASQVMEKAQAEACLLYTSRPRSKNGK